MVLFFYFYAILSILGIPVSTLLASAGIVSVALGLGAQGFVTDIVTDGEVGILKPASFKARK